MTYFARCTRCGKTFNDRSQAEVHGQDTTITVWQIGRAYEQHFGRKIEKDTPEYSTPYNILFQRLQEDIGCDKALEMALAIAPPRL